MSDKVECSICIDFYSDFDGDSFVVTTCGHLYHKFCIQRELSLRPRCPECLGTVSKEGFQILHGVDPGRRNSPKQFKITTIGDSGVGKTALVKRYCNQTFSGIDSTTIGADPFFKTLKIADKEIKLNIWDTAGQEVYRAVTPQYLRDSHGIVIVYDSLHRETLENCWDWFKFAADLAPNAVKILLGARCDLSACSFFLEKGSCPYSTRGRLPSQPCRPPTPQEVQEMADRMGVVHFLTSAKCVTNVDIAFRTLTGLILQNRYLVADAIKNDPSRRRIVTEKVLDSKKKKSGCC